MSNLTVYDIFTPTDLPSVTYVDRSERDLESQLRGALRTPKMVASLSGPSKSGKTVLIRKILESDNLITISGAAVSSPKDLWDRVLRWMDTPSSVSVKRSNEYGLSVDSKIKGGANVLFLKGDVEAGAGVDFKHGSDRQEEFERGGIEQVIKEIGDSPFVLFIDDFHYMSRETQAAVARQIKEISEAGVKVCTASVPHRKDDVVRGNPELRGRVQSIDFNYWSDVEIRTIALLGFRALNVILSDDIIDRMARESFGSPQLMQQICLQACLRSNIFEPYSLPTRMNFTREFIKSVLEQTSTTTDFSSLLEALHNGPKVRGAPRSQFKFKDGTTGDVYRSILLAMQMDPPRLSFNYDEIFQRVRSVCIDGSPPGSSISQALEQMPQIAEDLEPLSRIIEWSDDVLDISDPYFLYFLRCSPKIRSIAKAR